ncbi:MAG: helix-turn-helix transcriptional regulator [Bifidobacterium sp.]|nr:helix-turn-helix transcriptional regulator [Bifidobacterium sp.]
MDHGDDKRERLDDQIVGANFTKLREQADMSMDVLAAHMRDKGYRWSKSTVYNIERGERSLKLTEAVDALRALGMDPNTTIQRLFAHDEEEQARQLVKSMENSADSLQRSMAAFNNACAVVNASALNNPAMQETIRKMSSTVLDRLSKTMATSIPPELAKAFSGIGYLQPHKKTTENQEPMEPEQ